MSGSTIGGVVGGVVGFFFGAPQIGYVIGSAIGGAVDPEEIRGPSIGDAQRQTSQAGIPRPVVYGHPAPFNGNIIDGETQARKIEQTEGGKGGPEVTTERFILTSAIRICEGPIAGVLKIWRNDQLVYDRTSDADFPDWSSGSLAEQAAYRAAIRAKTSAFNGRIAIYYGDETQLPDPTLEAIHGVGNTPRYRGTAYIVVKDDDVTDMRGAAAQWKFEVVQSGVDGPAAVTTPDFSPAPQNGIGGGSPPGGALNIIDIQEFTGGSNIILVRFTAENDYMVSDPLPWAPSAGLTPAAGFTPSRLMVKDLSGATWFDSGWMGDPVQQTDLDLELSVNGFPAGPIVPNMQVGIVSIPPDIGALTAWVYRAGLNVTFPNQIGSSGDVTMQFPDPALLPATVVTTPEYPGALLGSDGVIYYPSWVTPDAVPVLNPSDVFLGAVVADIASRCEVPAANLDVSALATEVIPGLLVAQQGPGADAILPTQRGFFYDFPEFDKKLRAILRGAPAVVAVTDDDLIDNGEEQTRPQQVEYPRLVSVVTQDPQANYAPVPQTSIRTSLEVEVTNEVQLPLAIPFGADRSKQIAEKLHKVLWAQAEGRIELPLPEQFSRITPSDTFTYSGRRWLIEKTDYADGQIIVQAAYDRASAYDSDATGQPAVPPSLPSSGLGGATIVQFLNISILSDLDDRLGFYVAVAGTQDGWRGATIQGRINSSDPFTDLVTISARSVIGSLVTELPNAPREFIDYDNTVRVTVMGELSSITFEQLLNEGNPCVIGEEICQFQTATFVSDGVYDLSVLTRGRLNSATATHAVGARFVLLNAPVFIERPSSWIGRTIELRAVTLGTVADNNQSFSVTWSPALSQTEWPPVQFSGSRDASNNVAISWVGQGRLGTNKDAHNSQFMDGYRVTITKGSSSVVYLTTAQSFPYSAAQQTLDFGSATGTLTVAIAAMNRITGASAELTGSIP